MTRLPSELQRLYLPQAPAGRETDPDDASLIDSTGQVRAMVLSLAKPADWDTLAKVWRGVQVDLELPAPAIAVAGESGYQLWFSLATPVPAAQAEAFLQSLRTRYLGDVRADRVGLMPALDEASTPPRPMHARLVPAPLQASGHWTAFVAQDLAPVFADEPWLDTRPNPDGQAELLSRLESIPPAHFQHALERLAPAPQPAAETTSASMPAVPAGASMPGPGPRAAKAGPWRDPKAFLLDVMNDDAVPLGLRIDAAKALLPYGDEVEPP